MTKLDKQYFVDAGRKGGESTRGKKKLRGDSEYYARLGRKGGRAKKKQTK